MIGLPTGAHDIETAIRLYKRRTKTDPNRVSRRRRWRRSHRSEQRHQFHDLVREVFGAFRQVPPQCTRRSLVRSRSEKLGGYRLDITEEQLKTAPRIEQGKSWEQANRDCDQEVHGYWEQPAPVQERPAINASDPSA
jgi:hypothetical protein